MQQRITWLDDADDMELELAELEQLEEDQAFLEQFFAVSQLFEAIASSGDDLAVAS